MTVSNQTANSYARMGGSARKVDDPRSDVEVDRDRIVHSHAFRRLQRKTQIVTVQTLDFFRTRLTHTIECAQLGRAITNRITDDSWQQVVPERRHLPDLVEAACLAHDLGHPPFGHTGEEALDSVLRERCGLRFEGNAQSFRIVTLLEPKKYRGRVGDDLRPLGLDLTRATLQAMTKYPWGERDERVATSSKFGVYDMPEDVEYFAWLWDDTEEQPHRTVATEILEAADDLAYAVHDIEDGIWARLIPIDQVAHLDPLALERIAAVARRRDPSLFPDEAAVEAEVDAVFGVLRAQPWARGTFDRSRAGEAGLKSFCSRLTDELISAVTSGGSLHWGTDPALQRRIAAMRAVIWVWMIDPPELVTRRHGQRRIVFDLFDGFMDEPAMLPYQDEWERACERGDAARARFVADHVASMTDAYALHLHAEMHGLQRPVGEL